MVDEGTTVLLTTQYLDEADQLAGNIAVIDHGTVIASGTPHELKARIGGRLDVVVADRAELSHATEVLTAFTGARTEPDVDAERAWVSVPVGTDDVTLPEVVRHLDQAGVKAVDVGIRKPTLDEVFLALTGKSGAQRQEANQ